MSFAIRMAVFAALGFPTAKHSRKDGAPISNSLPARGRVTLGRLQVDPPIGYPFPQSPLGGTP